jgi:hypothetical protein
MTYNSLTDLNIESSCERLIGALFLSLLGPAVCNSWTRYIRTFPSMLWILIQSYSLVSVPQRHMVFAMTSTLLAKSTLGVFLYGSPNFSFANTNPLIVVGEDILFWIPYRVFLLWSRPAIFPCWNVYGGSSIYLGWCLLGCIGATNFASLMALRFILGYNLFIP